MAKRTHSQDTFTETLTALMDLAKSLRLASEIASPCHTPQQKKFRMTSPDIKAAALAKREAYLKWKKAGTSTILDMSDLSNSHGQRDLLGL